MDLKPHNLLLHKGPDGRLTLKVADFGFAQHMQDAGVSGVRGSPLYMAPEMVMGRGGATVDLWSVGVILYECLFGAAPYSSNSIQELLDKIQRKQEIVIPSNAAISRECEDLLRSLLQHDPAQRISYEDFFKHEYLDLEHMPSPENYEKAVSLIKLAVCLDASGDLERAFSAYKESLRYLVPCVSCERDSVRRAALKAKLNSYMDRAEELKLYLSGQSTVQAGGYPAGYSAGYPAGYSGNSSNAQECTGKVETIQEAQDEPPAPAPAPAPCDKPKRFALRRLFGRQNSLPLLDNNDSTITSEASADKTHKTENEDACRIA